MSIGYPFEGTYLLTQEFGVNAFWYARYRLKGHNGLDFALPLGTPVRACAPGVVVATGNEFTDSPTYGHYVRIRHDNGDESLYAHLYRIDVQPQWRVFAGQQLGLSGNSGHCAGPHLHFAYRRYPFNEKNGFGGYTNPLPLIGA